MKLSSRFGIGRRADVLPDSNGSAGSNFSNDLKSPQVRTIHQAKRTPPPVPNETPYPSRFDEKPQSPSLFDRFRLSDKERRVAGELFGEPPAPAPTPEAKAQPKPAIKVARRKLDRGDITLGALGVTLALICALFPWYIFFNQDKFGVREFVFEGGRGNKPPASVGYQPQLVGKHFQTGEIPQMDLDFFPTATAASEDEQQARMVPVSEQPFPSDLVNYRLVHVANGRAMIQDDDGLWVVQPGSSLPDASKVASIVQRDGAWVLVTTHDKVVPLSQ